MWGDVIAGTDPTAANTYAPPEFVAYQPTLPPPGHGWMIMPFGRRADRSHPYVFHVEVSLWTTTNAVIPGLAATVAV
jgi:hypothetical protein